MRREFRKHFYDYKVCFWEENCINQNISTLLKLSVLVSRFIINSYGRVKLYRILQIITSRIFLHESIGLDPLTTNTVDIEQLDILQPSKFLLCILLSLFYNIRCYQGTLASSRPAISSPWRHVPVFCTALPMHLAFYSNFQIPFLGVPLKKLGTIILVVISRW